MSTAEMARRKRYPDTPGAKLAQQIVDQYHPENAEDVHNALKDIFGPIFEAMLQGEMDEHLGYKSNDHGSKGTDNRRNGYIEKSVNTSYGEVPISVPRDRDATFEPKVVPKRTKDVSGIEDKVLSMYAKGITTQILTHASPFLVC